MEEGVAATRGKEKKWTRQARERTSSRSTALEENVQKLLVEIKKKGGERRGRGETEAPPQTRL